MKTKVRRDEKIQTEIATKELRYSKSLVALKSMRNDHQKAKRELAKQRKLVADQKEDMFAEVITLVMGGTLPTNCLTVNESVLREIFGESCESRVDIAWKDLPQ